MSTTNKPTHRAYLVTKPDGAAKSDWKEIGAAWAQRDGRGLSLKLKGDLPAGTRQIVIRAVILKSDRGFA